MIIIHACFNYESISRIHSVCAKSKLHWKTKIIFKITSLGIFFFYIIIISFFMRKFKFELYNIVFVFFFTSPMKPSKRAKCGVYIWWIGSNCPYYSHTYLIINSKNMCIFIYIIVSNMYGFVWFLYLLKIWEKCPIPWFPLIIIHLYLFYLTIILHYLG